MSSRTKRSATRSAAPTREASETEATVEFPRPSPPQPNRRLLLLSSLLLLGWFGFLAWMALFG